MHYKNGREAKAGDRIINLTSGLSGVLHSPNAKSEKAMVVMESAFNMGARRKAITASRHASLIVRPGRSWVRANQRRAGRG